MTVDLFRRELAERTQQAGAIAGALGIVAYAG
jgi:hypothetical protein